MNLFLNNIIQRICLFSILIIISTENISASYIATGSFGAATIDGKIYNQISFRPEITFKKLGIGLDINLYIDENGEIYSKNWLLRHFSNGYVFSSRFYYGVMGRRD